MSDLEQQASAWVPPWQRPSSPDGPSDPSTSDTEASDTEALVADDPISDNHEVSSVDDAEDGGAANEGGESVAERGGVAGVGGAAGELAAAVQTLAAALPVQRVGKAGKAKDAGEAAGDGARPELAAQVAAAQIAAQEPVPELAEGELVPALEAILMVVDEPVSEITLAQVLDIEAEEVANALIDLSAAYTREGRGFDLRRAAGGWRYYTRADYSPYVERFVLDGQQLRLTQASLETLAVVAYKQPVTRSRISAIRGVNVDGVIRTLITRGMVEECGLEPESGAHLYRTTSLFLEKLGLNSVEELPPLAPFLPDNLEEIANGE